MGCVRPRARPSRSSADSTPRSRPPSPTSPRKGASETSAWSFRRANSRRRRRSMPTTRRRSISGGRSSGRPTSGRSNAGPRPMTPLWGPKFGRNRSERTCREHRERADLTEIAPAEHRSTSQWVRLKSDRPSIGAPRDSNGRCQAVRNRHRDRWRRRRRCGGRHRGPRCRSARYRLGEELRTRRGGHHLRRWLSGRRIAIAAAERYQGHTRPGPQGLDRMGGRRGTTGTGHKFIRQVGGYLTHMDQIWFYVSATPDYRDPAQRRSLVCRLVPGNIWVNQQGRRFHNEALSGGNSATPALMAQSPGHAWAIMDTPMTATMEVADPYYRDGDKVVRARVVELLNNSPFIRKADTLAELARRI